MIMIGIGDFSFDGTVELQTKRTNYVRSRCFFAANGKSQL